MVLIADDPDPSSEVAEEKYESGEYNNVPYWHKGFTHAEVGLAENDLDVPVYEWYKSWGQITLPGFPPAIPQQDRRSSRLPPTPLKW